MEKPRIRVYAPADLAVLLNLEFAHPGLHSKPKAARGPRSSGRPDQPPFPPSI